MIKKPLVRTPLQYTPPQSSQPSVLSAMNNEKNTKYYRKEINYSNVSPRDGYVIRRDKLHVIAGATETGKSQLLLNILRHNAQLWDQIYFYCKTLDQQDIYKGIVPPKFISTDLEALVEKLITEQSLPQNKNRHICIVGDDLIGCGTNLRTSDTLNKLATSSRHSRLTVLILLQDLKAVSPTIRTNIDTLFITKIKANSINAAFEIVSNIPNEYQLREFLDTHCVNYNVIKFNLSSGYNENSISIFKPEMLKQRIRFEF